MREPVDENDEQTRRGLLGIYLLSPRHAALEEKKNAVRLAFFFLGRNTIISEHASAFYYLLLKDFFLGWLRFAIFDRCILLHCVWEDGAA